MKVYSKTIYGAPGLDYVQDIAFVYAHILNVKREGIGYCIRTSDPENRECKPEVSTGKIFFSTVFSGPTGEGRPNRFSFERITVTYKI